MNTIGQTHHPRPELPIKYRREGNADVFTLEWADVRQGYLDYTEGKRTPRGNRLRRWIENWNSGQSFYGPTGEQVRTWIREGYELPELKGTALPTEQATAVDWEFNDTDGEFQQDLWDSGDAEYYLDSTTTASPSGISIRFGNGFLGDVQAGTISQYGAWSGSLTEYLRNQGFDLDIRIRQTGRNRYSNSSGTTHHDTVVRRFGEIDVPSDWSVLFSPACYRHLGFFTTALVGEQKVEGADGKPHHRNACAGGSTSPGWDIKWDAETRTLEVQVNSRGGHGSFFPADEMTAKVMALGEELVGS